MVHRVRSKLKTRRPKHHQIPKPRRLNPKPYKASPKPLNPNPMALYPASTPLKPHPEDGNTWNVVFEARPLTRAWFFPWLALLATPMLLCDYNNNSNNNYNNNYTITPIMFFCD